MFKMIVLIISSILLQSFSVSYSQSKEYLSDILYHLSDSTWTRGYSLFDINYWRHSESLFIPNAIDRYNTSGCVWHKIIQKGNVITNEILEQNYTAPYGKIPRDTFRYIFNKADRHEGLFVRKILIKEKYLKIDTFRLVLIDSFVYVSPKLIRKVFGIENASNQKSLKIYVFKSEDVVSGTMFHYWVERIGVVKLADVKCWRYSFEVSGESNLHKEDKKMFNEIYKVIKKKYKDPYWPSSGCPDYP